MIYVAVSTANGCQYCIHSHTAAAKGKGMTPDMHAELLAVIGMAIADQRAGNGAGRGAGRGVQGVRVGRAIEPRGLPPAAGGGHCPRPGGAVGGQPDVAVGRDGCMERYHQPRFCPYQARTDDARTCQIEEETLCSNMPNAPLLDRFGSSFLTSSARSAALFPFPFNRWTSPCPPASPRTTYADM